MSEKVSKHSTIVYKTTLMTPVPIKVGKKIFYCRIAILEEYTFYKETE